MHSPAPRISSITAPLGCVLKEPVLAARPSRELSHQNRRRLPREPFALAPHRLLETLAIHKTVLQYRDSQVIFSQGDPAGAVYYIEKGAVKLTVCSRMGKEAVVAILGQGDFFGEGCLSAQTLRMSTTSAMGSTTVLRLEKTIAEHFLASEPGFSELFLSHLLARNARMEADLVDQLFNSSEKRLARLLLVLARAGKASQQDAVISQVSQETLAQMVGTTQSRVSFFMNKFRTLGFVAYGRNAIHVHGSLLNILLHD